jgi:hypothetical protein
MEVVLKFSKTVVLKETAGLLTAHFLACALLPELAFSL